jgi:hypothetical protein
LARVAGIARGIERRLDTIVTRPLGVNLINPVIKVFAGEVPALPRGPL